LLNERERREFIAAEVERIQVERVKKLELLCSHYRIEAQPNEGKYLILALRLAVDFVPGFQADRDQRHRGPGAPRRNTAERLHYITVMIGAMQRLGLANNDASACALFVEIENPELKRSIDRKKRARTIQNLLPAGRKLLADRYGAPIFPSRKPPHLYS
jgi:hypothetical protein